MTVAGRLPLVAASSLPVMETRHPFLAFVLATAALAAWPSVLARAQPVTPTLELEPSSGPPGTSFTIAGIGYEGCDAVTLTWDGRVPIALTFAAGSPSLLASFEVPADERPGPKRVEAVCSVASDDPPEVQVTPAPTTAPPKPAAATPDAIRLRKSLPQEDVVAVSETFTVVARAAPTGAPTSPAAPSASPGASSSPPLVLPEPGSEGLVMDSPSVEPGGSVVASGDGCRAGRPVVMLLDGERVTSVDAAPDGSFTAELSVPLGAAVGRHVASARCGRRILSAPLDVALVQANSAPPVAPLVTFALFLFVVLEAKDFLEIEPEDRSPERPS